MAGIVYHVAPATDGWSVTREGRRSLIHWAPRREEAIERARRELLKHPSGVLRIHDDAYAVVEELTAEQLAGASDHASGRTGY